MAGQALQERGEAMDTATIEEIKGICREIETCSSVISALGGDSHAYTALTFHNDAKGFSSADIPMRGDLCDELMELINDFYITRREIFEAQLKAL
jgi:hypothetical protein